LCPLFLAALHHLHISFDLLVVGVVLEALLVGLNCLGGLVEVEEGRALALVALAPGWLQPESPIAYLMQALASSRAFWYCPELA
jgi:hypothetical protein